MIRRSAAVRLARCPVAWVLALALATAGCGEPDAAPTESSSGPRPQGPGTSEPARASVDEPGVRTLIAGLRLRVERGTGLDDPAFGKDASYLASLLWPSADDDAHQRARREHARLTNVAGDLSRPLVKDAAARASLAQDDPIGLEIHDAWLAAADRTPDLYRAWVEREGAELAKRLQAERAKLFERR